MIRNEPSVVIKGHIPLPPESVEYDQQASMFLVDMRPDEFNDRDVVSRLASGAEAVAEHESEGNL